MDPQTLAACLFAARATQQPWAPLEADGVPLTLGPAYDVQQAFNVLQAPDDPGAIAGYKVGLTSKAMQAFCGVDEPISGIVFAGRIHGSGAIIAASDFLRLGIECEIALRLKADIPALTGNESPQQLHDCIETVHAAFEIVEDRDADYSRLDAGSIVAENSWNMGMVVSDGVPAAGLGDLAAISARMWLNGAPAGQGRGEAALGSPAFVMRWLAGFLSRRGEKLMPGQWVMTGSLLPTVFPAKGDKFRFALDGLVAVELSVS